MSNDNYATPEWLMNVFEDWYDPCPLDPNPEIDGLSIEWKKKTYVNPPYSNPLPWVLKAIEEKNKGNTIVMLLRADSSTKYFQKCQEHGEVIYFGRRIKFNGRTPYFASMLVVFVPETRQERHNPQFGCWCDKCSGYMCECPCHKNRVGQDTQEGEEE